jgi:hypothetical protein
MSWTDPVKKKPGRPPGVANDKPFTDALKIALARTGQDGKRALNRLAEKLIRCALDDGAGWAFSQIADRIEGKVKEQIEIKKDYRDLAEYSDAELTALLRDRVLQLKPISAERPDGETLN